MPPQFWRAKRQHNLLFRNACPNKIVCHTFFRAVTLNIDFVAHYINMNKTAVNTTNTISSN